MPRMTGPVALTKVEAPATTGPGKIQTPPTGDNAKSASFKGGKSFTLRSGDVLPAIGMGTFTGTRLTQRAEKIGPGGVMEENIKAWIRAGGRMIDAAQNYLNEAEIGDAIAACIAEGTVKREDLFVSSKLNNPYHDPYEVPKALRKSLTDLKLDYLDMYLMHWPVPFVPVPYEADPDYPDGRGHGKEYEPDQCSKVTGKLWSETHWDKTGEFPPHLLTGVSVHDTWKSMVILKEAGLTRNVGVCNMNVQLLNELCIVNFKHLPSVLQCESHPYCQQPGLLKYCQKMGIQFQGFSPLGYGEFRAGHEIAPLKDPVIAAIASKHGVSTAQVCLRWTNQRGVATMPFTLKANEMAENLDIWKFTLDDEDMAQMASLDKNHHYLRPADWFGLELWN